jgi:hypothetical protein
VRRPQLTEEQMHVGVCVGFIDSLGVVRPPSSFLFIGEG